MILSSEAAPLGASVTEMSVGTTLRRRPSADASASEAPGLEEPSEEAVS